MNKNLTTIRCAAVLAACCLTLRPALAASEERVNRNFDVQPNGKVLIDVDFGTIDVQPGEDNKASVDAIRQIHFDDSAAEKKFIEDAPILVSSENNILTLRARRTSQDKHDFSWHHARMDARYTVRVPKTFGADLHTGGGRINVAQLTGEIRADSGGGEQKFSQLHGPLTAHSGGGAVKVDGCNEAIEIETGGGEIVFANGQGKLNARTGGGAIEVRDFVGDISVRTGGGGLTLERVDGALEGTTSGGSISASISRGPVKKITLESSGGSIDLALPKDAAVDVQARTGSGRVHSDLPFQVTRRDDEHLEGKLNGGGSPLLLRTASGNIDINSSAPETASR